ncbi:hypothetical protein ACFPRL_10420 [Pseudoclavibacter helvolus]
MGSPFQTMSAPRAASSSLRSPGESWAPCTIVAGLHSMASSSCQPAPTSRTCSRSWSDFGRCLMGSANASASTASFT